MPLNAPSSSAVERLRAFLASYWLAVALVAIWAACLLPSLFEAELWYDEAITVLQLAANVALPAPETIAPASEYKQLFDGRASLSDIPRILRDHDVHPPVYYWVAEIWSWVFGGQIGVIRALFTPATASPLLLAVRLAPPSLLADHITPSLWVNHRPGLCPNGDEGSR